MDTTIKNLTAAAQGLLLRSETDAPFTPIDLGEEPIRNLRSEWLAPLLGILPESRCEEMTLEDFFHSMTNPRPGARPERLMEAKRFKFLQSVIERELAGARVFRFGERRIDAFILGWTREGRLIGLKTVQVET